MDRRGMDSKIDDAKETIDTLSEISHLLNCGLDKESLSIIVSLIELGINPDALAAAVKVCLDNVGCQLEANITSTGITKGISCS